jgi:hypothetical protein
MLSRAEIAKIRAAIEELEKACDNCNDSGIRTLIEAWIEEQNKEVGVRKMRRERAVTFLRRCCAPMKFSEMFKSEQRPESGKKYCGWVQKHLTLHSVLNCQAELTNGFGIFSLSQVRAYRGLEPIKNQNNPIIINSLAQIAIHYPVMCGDGNAPLLSG